MNEKSKVDNDILRQNSIFLQFQHWFDQLLRAYTCTWKKLRAMNTETVTFHLIWHTFRPKSSVLESLSSQSVIRRSEKVQVELLESHHKHTHTWIRHILTIKITYTYTNKNYKHRHMHRKCEWNGAAYELLRDDARHKSARLLIDMGKCGCTSPSVPVCAYFKSKCVYVYVGVCVCLCC